MAVSLIKGGNVSFDKETVRQQAANTADPEAAQQLNQLADVLPEGGPKRVRVGLGWDVRTTTGTDFDLDASALLLNANGKVASDADFVFFNNPKSPCGCVEHLGDNLTGKGEGDDERLVVDLEGLSSVVERVIFPVSIFDAENRGQSFGQVRNAFIRIVDLSNPAAGEVELARYDLSEDAATETAMLFGELYRHNGTWKFKALGTGYSSGLQGIAQDFGVNV